MNIVAALLLLAASQPETPTRSICAGGRMILFDAGSDRITPPGIDMLEAYAEASRARNADSDIHIESGGDGTRAAFDAELSRRRSEVIRAFLVERGFAPARIRIHVQHDRGVGADPGDVVDRRIGHVYELVSPEDYRRLAPPGMIIECF